MRTDGSEAFPGKWERLRLKVAAPDSHRPSQGWQVEDVLWVNEVTGEQQDIQVQRKVGNAGLELWDEK